MARTVPTEPPQAQLDTLGHLSGDVDSAVLGDDPSSDPQGDVPVEWIETGYDQYGNAFPMLIDGYMTSGELDAWLVDNPQEPGDGGGEAVTAQQVADFLGQGTSTPLVALAGEHVPVVTAMVKSYTRGNGFTDGVPNDDLGAVIVTATARLLANPEQIGYSVGDTTVRGGFTGFSLAETFVLNRYRKRAA